MNRRNFFGWIAAIAAGAALPWRKSEATELVPQCFAADVSRGSQKVRGTMSGEGSPGFDSGQLVSLHLQSNRWKWRFRARITRVGVSGADDGKQIWTASYESLGRIMVKMER